MFGSQKFDCDVSRHVFLCIILVWVFWASWICKWIFLTKFVIVRLFVFQIFFVASHILDHLILSLQVTEPLFWFFNIFFLFSWLGNCYWPNLKFPDIFLSFPNLLLSISIEFFISDIVLLTSRLFCYLKKRKQLLFLYWQFP